MNTTTQFANGFMVTTNVFTQNDIRFETIFRVGPSGCWCEVNCNSTDMMSMDSLSESKEFAITELEEMNKWSNELRANVIFGRTVLS